MASTLFAGDRPLIVLAPMAGITNRAYRRLCREASHAIYPAGAAALYVCEMITSRALIERDAETMSMIEFGAEESPRSLQLYGVDPKIVAAAVRMIVTEDRADHIDLNMGCPVPKVTRKGGGSALPWKRDLFRNIVEAAIEAADDRVPVSVKMRMGIDPEHLTYIDAGIAAADAGVAWVALHGRTAIQMYSGHADWSAIATLKQELSGRGVPVLGNGDIWTGADAVRMHRETGCDGVVIGRGCLGRPWLFGQIAAAFDGAPAAAEPDIDGVRQLMLRHCELLVAMHGDEDKGCREMRKHMAWYLKGFVVGSEVRQRLGLISSLAEFAALLTEIEGGQPYPVEIAEGPRGRTSGAKWVSLPDGWLDSRELAAGTDLSSAEIGVSGG
jgi:nifR3 family TIM-barrel protein